MSINIDPEKFAELVVMSNPSKFEDAEDIAKESLKLYIISFSREIFNNCNKLL
ncbi:hypothetical protein M6K172_1630 [Staphylococcus aureus]|nr:hypothetical protein M1K172_0568 [Staphylococcus aureus]GBZ72461.1 hypothetical protein M6K172_1630 [Staphylococcus aureus]